MRSIARSILVVLVVVANACAESETVTGRIVHVSDGDTIIVARGRHERRVRLIGIDTPELHESEKLDRDAARTGASRASIQAMGQRARDAARALLLGRTVRLEYDVERRDRHGRDLAYVWFDDGTMANERLVRDGWAKLYTIPPNVRYEARLRDAQTAARAAGRGIWTEATMNAPAPREAPQARVPAQHGCPHERPYKGNVTIRDGRRHCIVHAPGDQSYDATRPEQCYATIADAERDGCRAARR